MSCPARVPNAPQLIPAISLPTLVVHGHYLCLSGCMLTFAFLDNPGGNQALDLNSQNELAYQSGSLAQAVFQVSPRRFDKEYESKLQASSLEMPRPT